MTLASAEKSCARALSSSAMLMMVIVFLLVSVGLDWPDVDGEKPMFSSNGKGRVTPPCGVKLHKRQRGSKQPWTLDATG
jgi:hypothetical protein